MTRNISGMPGHRTLTPAEKLAGAFAKEIRDALSPETLNRVQVLNRYYTDKYGEDRASERGVRPDSWRGSCMRLARLHRLKRMHAGRI